MKIKISKSQKEREREKEIENKDIFINQGILSHFSFATTAGG